MTIEPVVTIVTVVYNNVEYIENAIQSVLSQKYKNIEYIVIDGDSNDGTVDIINKYSGKISQFLSESDNGYYEALNKGIKLSNGNFLGVLNSDDEFYDEYSITSVVDEFLRSDAEFVHSDVILMDKRLKKVSRHYRSYAFNKRIFKTGWMPPHPACFFKKSIFTEFGGYSTQFAIAGDFDYLVKIFYNRKIKATYLNQVLVKMRTGGMSNSGVKSKIIISKEIHQSLRNHKVFSMYFFHIARYVIRLIQTRF